VPRLLLPGQTSRLLVVDAVTGEAEVAFRSGRVLVEAPNWSPDGRWLVVNGDGLLWRLPADARDADETDLVPVPLGDVPEINNDHVIAPDQRTVVVSARDGHLYEVPWDGVEPGGSARRVTRDHPPRRNHKNYLHGVSPDGTQLSVVVGALPAPVDDPDGEEARAGWRTDVALVSVADGTATAVTADEHPDDGPEFSPDGRWLWWNSERASGGVAGHAQLFRAAPDGGDLVQVTHDERVNWFPHPSPDGRTLLWLAYEPGTTGHPADRDVELRTMPLGDDGLPVPGAEPRTLRALQGGQGTVNVPCWAPDSRRFACADYPRG
jgi:TolB protein